MKPSMRSSQGRQQQQQQQRVIGSRGEQRKASVQQPVKPTQRSNNWQFQQQDLVVPAPFRGVRGPLKFVGQIRHATTPQKVRYVVDELLALANESRSHVVVGMDTETSVKWRQSDEGKWYTENAPVSLLQLCYQQPDEQLPTCLLLQLSNTGFPSAMGHLLSHPNILKVGIGLPSDVFELQRDYQTAADVEPQSVLDLSWLATKVGVLRPLSPQIRAAQEAKHALNIKTFYTTDSWGLAGLLEHTTEYTLTKSKKITTSNWARQPLSRQQVEYACCDALASLMCYSALKLRWLQQHAQRTPEREANRSLLPGQSLHTTSSHPHQDNLLKQQLCRPQQQTLVPGGGAESSDMPFTLTLPGLMQLNLDKGVGQVFQFEAPDQVQQTWRQVLKSGCRASVWQLQRTRENALWKAESMEPGDWLLEGTTSSACSGWMDSPW